MSGLDDVAKLLTIVAGLISGGISVQVDQAVQSIESCNSLDELKSTMQAIVENAGFASWSFVDAGRPYDHKPFYFGTSGQAWESEYASNRFVTVDPYISLARRTNRAFDWSAIEIGTARRGPKSGAKRLMDAAADHRLKQGLVVPYHFKDRIGRSHSVCSVFYWKDSPDDFSKVITDRRWQLHLVMIYFIQRVMDILAIQQRNERPIFSVHSAQFTVSLTDREKDLLSWAARGKTLAETATILGISTLTAESYMKNVLEKLNATSKTHAVALAITLSLIDV